MNTDKKKIEHVTLDLYKIDPFHGAPQEEDFDTPEEYRKAYADFMHWWKGLEDQVAYGATIQIFYHFPLSDQPGDGLQCQVQTTWLKEDEALKQLGGIIAQQIKNLFDEVGASYPEVKDESAEGSQP